jgi:single-strand DNA-binding protein
MNQCSFIGNLGRDAESKVTGGGKTYLRFSIAVRPNYVPKGTEKPVPNWINVVLWGKTAEYMAGLGKGERVFVSGEYQTRTYQKKDGTTGYSHEINSVVCHRVAKNAAPSSSSGGEPGYGGAPGYDPEVPGSAGGFTEDDIPF